jgi:hypothetical protein
MNVASIPTIRIPHCLSMGGTQPPQDIDTPSPALVSALRQLLKPLVRLLISRGISFPFLVDMLKGAYFEVAEQSFTLPGKRQTDSRVSLITGLHRKDVKRLRETAGQSPASKATPPLSALLIARWTGDRLFSDSQGTPLPLARLATMDAEKSFDALVTGVSKDIRPRAVLDEWLRQGIARLDSEDRVHLLMDAFVPAAGQDDKTYYFGRNLHDHVAAGVHNLLGEQPPLLERNVYYDQLTPESVQRLAALSREEGMRALQALNRAALDMQERDSGNPKAKQRMSFGVYFYTPATDGNEQADD